MSEQEKPQARIVVVGDHVDVGCTYEATRLPLDSQEELRDQITAAVFAHERQCGRCDTKAAYERGAPGFARNIDIAHHMQDRLDEEQAVHEAERPLDDRA